MNNNNKKLYTFNKNQDTGFKSKVLLDVVFPPCQSSLTSYHDSPTPQLLFIVPYRQISGLCRLVGLPCHLSGDHSQCSKKNEAPKICFSHHFVSIKRRKSDLCGPAFWCRIYGLKCVLKQDLIYLFIAA